MSLLPLRYLRFFSPERLIALAVLLAALALRVADPIPLQNLRFMAFDAFQQAQPREPQPAPVTILDIDDASLEALGQWPWPRSLLAELVTRTFEEGAVALAFDIIFAEPDRLSPSAVADANPALPLSARQALADLPSNDEILAQAMTRGRVVVGQTSTRFSSLGQLAPSDAAPREVPHALLGEDARPFLQTFPDLVENLPIFEDAAVGRGLFSVRPDADGIYRRIPVVMVVDSQLRLGLGPELLRIATGGQAFALRGNTAGAEGVVVGGQLVQTAADGTVWPYLTPSRPERYVSAADLLSGTLPTGRLGGQLVLVGTSAIGLEDFRPTGLGTSMAGVEIHAQALENILTSTLLVRPNYAIAVELIVLGALGLVVIALVPIMGAGLTLSLGLLLMVGYGAITWFLFQDQRILLDPTWPTLGAFATILLMASANYLREERERQHVRNAFGQYVSSDLVERLSQDPKALQLGGERRDLTILFSDVRGFTGLAEAYRDDPAGLTSLMNTFLTVLSREILNERGTIDKFMGDAVMAFWNAPLDTADHAAAGCRAALAMQSAIAKLNAERAQEAEQQGSHVPHIDVGIGLNTGDCVVGNMGSEDRFDYTALGDTVNLASRLEGQSKAYGVGIIVGESVAQTVGDQFALLELDLLRVKGKQTPERIFGLMGDQELAETKAYADLQTANTNMRKAYTGQQWEEVEAELDELVQAGSQVGLHLDGYTDLYRGRIAMFRAQPPGDGWDGVHDATSK